ncbi:MAG: hypothetical protein F6K26_43980 [Moorea sp. SIO2I5]|nr:hypothetical protein [Moorena sp. SIO2I5]
MSNMSGTNQPSAISGQLSAVSEQRLALRARYANSDQHSVISYQLTADRCFTGWKPVPQS